MLLSVFSVPEPTIVISKSYNGLIYAGNHFALNAEIMFSDPTVVNVEISLAITWTKDGNMIRSNDHINISPVGINGSDYTASLTYSPIATSDSGLITATVTVSSSVDSMYIQSVNATAVPLTLSVQGIEQPILIFLYWYIVLRHIYSHLKSQHKYSRCILLNFPYFRIMFVMFRLQHEIYDKLNCTLNICDPNNILLTDEF